MHAQIQANRCRCSHKRFIGVKQVSFSLLSLLPVVWELSTSRVREGGWWARGSTLRSLSLWLFNLFFLLVAVICFLSQWLKRHRAATSGPQEDVLTPPTNSPPRPTAPPPLCLNGTLAWRWKVQKGLLPETIQSKHSGRLPVIRKIFRTQQRVWIESGFIDSLVHLLVQCRRAKSKGFVPKVWMNLRQ